MIAGNYRPEERAESVLHLSGAGCGVREILGGPGGAGLGDGAFPLRPPFGVQGDVG